MINIATIRRSSIVFSVIATFFVIISFLVSFIISSAPIFKINSGIMLLFVVFAFISGILMFGSRGVYPFALTLVPKKINKEGGSNLVRAFVFSIVTVLVFSLFGFVFSNISNLFTFKLFDTKTISPYLYIILGFIAYIITFSEFGLIKLERTTFIKNIPNLLKKSKGIFGVALFAFIISFVDIIPSTWLLLSEATIENNSLYGVLLLCSHAFGRIFPLVILAILSKFGVDGTSWLSRNKNNFNKGLGVIVIILAALIINLGLNIISPTTGSYLSHLFKEFLSGGFILLFLLMFPVWLKFFLEKKRVYGSPELDLHVITQKIKGTEDELRNLNLVHKFSEPVIIKRINNLKDKLNELSYESKILESSLRYGSKYSPRSKEVQKEEEKNLKLRLAFTICITLLTMSFISIIAVS